MVKCWLLLPASGDNQVLADDTTQDYMRSLIAVFRPFRIYAAEYELRQQHGVTLFFCSLNVYLFVVSNSVSCSKAWFLHGTEHVYAQDRDVQRQDTACLKHALSLASGKRVERLVRTLAAPSWG